jgi:glycerol-3-phosphate dehydrogenase
MFSAIAPPLAAPAVLHLHSFWRAFPDGERLATSHSALNARSSSLCKKTRYDEKTLLTSCQPTWWICRAERTAGRINGLVQAERPGVADLFVIGGGINGCGIARDAAGRGLSVTLAEQGDLAQATSSASTKLFHGGLRYLEFFEFRLVRESLEERETLLVAMPHISWPMRFVLPWHPGMRFDSDTPTSRLLARVMPWMRGRRPAWLIRLGLFLYDTMGGRKILPATRTLDLTADPAGRPLKPEFRKAWEYSDCWVEDSRLVVLNARDAEARGARIMVRARVVSAARDGDVWEVVTEGEAGRQVHHARALVNAAGPWVSDVVREVTRINTPEKVRLVRGSHIVTRKLYDHDRCYFFQGQDGRIIFAIPYEGDFTLIGTTDKDHTGTPSNVACTPEEQDYLLAFASHYFAKPVTAEDVVWSYSGVRPLYDDGASSATQATRDYVLRLDTSGPPLLNVFGGKITTYRRLAESALAQLMPFFPGKGSIWTARVPLPGGDFPHDGFEALVARLTMTHPFLAPAQARRLVRAYGTEAFDLLTGVASASDLGQHFGAGLTEAEVRWLVDREYARSAEDIVWRRSKLGLRMTAAEIAALDDHLVRQRMGRAAE